MQDFCNLLLDPPSGDELDLFLLFEISDRLLQELLYLENLDSYAVQLNIHISVCYANVNRTARLTKARGINTFYRDEGLKAARAAVKLMEKDNFLRLGVEGRKEIVRAVKLYSALYDTFFAQEDTNVLRYEALEDAIRTYYDDFYRENTPGYPWDRHLYKTIEHMSQLTERGNRWGFSVEQCLEICEHLKTLQKMWDENSTDIREKIPEFHYRLVMLRNSYYAGLMVRDA